MESNTYIKIDEIPIDNTDLENKTNEMLTDTLNLEDIKNVLNNNKFPSLWRSVFESTLLDFFTSIIFVIIFTESNINETSAIIVSITRITLLNSIFQDIKKKINSFKRLFMAELILLNKKSKKPIYTKIPLLYSFWSFIQLVSVVFLWIFYHSKCNNCSKTERYVVGAIFNVVRFVINGLFCYFCYIIQTKTNNFHLTDAIKSDILGYNPLNHVMYY